jgi:hypothetical protein
MASKKLSSDTSLANSYKLSRGVASVACPSAPTIGTATDTGSGLMSVTFTASTLGPTASSFTLTSSSGVTGSGASSPLTLQEVVEGTYTYNVYGTNANGNGPSSATSNSVNVTSVDPSAYFPIATTTLTTTTSTVTFSSIPQTYKHLQLRMWAKSDRANSAGNTIFAYANGDNAPTSPTNYWTHGLTGDGSSTTSGSLGNTAGTGYGFYVGTAQGATPASYGSVAIVDFLDYSNTNKYKTMRAFSGEESNQNNASSTLSLRSTLWSNTAAITSLQLTCLSYNFVQYSTFTLYGIKG